MLKTQQRNKLGGYSNLNLISISKTGIFKHIHGKKIIPDIIYIIENEQYLN